MDFIQKIIEKAASDQVGAVINVSSQSVYSQQRTSPADESFPIVLESKYAVGKYWSELFVNTVCRNIRHTNLRMASLIGAGFNQRITNKFAAKVIASEQIMIAGGEQLFGFLDVRDAAAGIIKVVLSDGIWNEVYNLGTNSGYTLRQIAEAVAEQGTDFGYKAPKLECFSSDEWHNSSIICNRFMNDFSWTPEYDLRSTINSIFKSLN